MESIRILIADDQALMRDGVKTILELQEDMKVVATAANGQIAYELTAALRPQVVLMDMKMPILDGIESTKLIKRDFPDTFVIMLSTFDEEEFIMDALCVGASSYLLKDMPGEDIVQAIRFGMAGTVLMSKYHTSKVLSLYGNSNKKQKSNLESFSEREEEIIQYMIQGFTNKRMASTLYITEGTVKNYVSSIYSKIGINERAKAVLYFKAQGMGNAV